MLTERILLSDILTSITIIIFSVGLALVYYFLIRKLLVRLSRKTGTQFDDLIVKAVEWPVFVLIILAGCYLTFVFLPFQGDYDFVIRRVFHLFFIILGAMAIGMAIDALFRWFKMEVISRTNTPIDDWFIFFIRLVSPFIVGIAASLVVLGLYEIQADAYKNWVLTYGTRITLVIVVTIIVLFSVGVIVSKGIKVLLSRRPPEQSLEEALKRTNTLSSVILTSLQVFIIVIAIFIILSEFINITPALASLGVVGIAVGLGAQSLVKDMIAGFFIVTENQFRVGDVVSIAGIRGLVEDINLRRTIVRDIDGVVHTVPNGLITVASDFTKGFSRVNLNISVAYGPDLDRAIVVANRVCSDMAEESLWAPLIIKTPAVLRVDKLGDSGIELKITGDTKPIEQWAVMGEIRKRLVKAFEQEGIEIPFPHTKVYFGNSSVGKLPEK